MAEEVIRDLSVRWITSRIEYAANTSDLERFFFEASDKNSYYIDLNKTNVASEIAAINLTRDAFLHNKKVNVDDGTVFVTGACDSVGDVDDGTVFVTGACDSVGDVDDGTVFVTGACDSVGD